MEDFYIHVVTWNVGTSFPIRDFKDLLISDDELNSDGESYQRVPDLYVIGLQEVKSQPQNIVWDTFFEDPWTVKAKEILAPLGLVKIHTIRMQGLMTNIFIKRNYITAVRDIETLCTRRGLGGIWGNKGAVSVRLGVRNCSLCFVNCHLTAHDHLLRDRIDDYKNILSGQSFTQPETSNILFHDYTFWFGDTNFRLDGTKTAEAIVEDVSRGEFASLLEEDQLNKVRKSGEAFSELSELKITFPPTYKLMNGVDKYDIKRRPGWTDRILYQVNANVYDNLTLEVEGLSYKSHSSYRTSDHRPVTAEFRIKVFKANNEKLVKFHDVGNWNLGECNKVFFKVCPLLHTSVEDWIAIYKADFTSIEEYVSYVYSPQNLQVPSFDVPLQANNSTHEYSVVFSENCIVLPGSYVLMYFSHASRSIFGMSNAFSATTRS